MQDRDKTKDELIAELELLRSEVAALQQAGRSQSATGLPQIASGVATLTLPDSLGLATRPEATGQYTILFVDDSEVDRATYRRFLLQDSDRTYNIVEFNNGEDALQWCQHQIPDILLLDYYLPDIDGLELLEELLQQSGRNTLPAIVLTGQGNLQIAVDLLKSGAQDYLEKSQITPEVLQRSISYVLRHSQLMREREWQRQQQQILAKTALAIRDSLKLEDILNTTVTEIRNILLCDRVIIFQLAPDWSGRVVVESVGSEATPILSTQIHDPCLSESYFEPFRQGLVTAKSDIYKAQIAACHLELLTNLQVRANLVVPILQGENLWGLLIAHHCVAPREWQASEIELLRQLSAQASIAIQQADLLEQLQTELRDRKQAELTLQETQEKLQLFIKYAPASIVMFDRSMCYLAASQRWVDEFQMDDLGSIIGRSHYELFPNIPDEWKQFHQRGLAGFIEKCDEDRFVHSDGSQQWLRWEIHPWYRSNGDVGGIILFTEDITDRKQAQIALQQINTELEKRVASRTTELTEVNDRLLVTLLEKDHAYQLLKEQAQLLDLAHDSIITWDLNSVISFWNQGAELMYGWTKAEVFGQELHSLFKTQFPQPLAEIKAELFETGYWEGELIHCTRDKHQITVSSRWVVQKDDAGRPIKILEINHDVTPKKQAELVLQQYIHEIEDLYNQAPCGYHSLDAVGTIVRINDTELKWLGYDRDEIVNKKNFLDLLKQDSKKIFYDNFPLFKKQGWIDNLEFEILNKDGSTRWISLNASAIKDDAGNFLMSRSSMFDISDRKQIEIERKQAELALRESEESRRLALDLTNTGFWDMDTATKSQIWNDNLFKLLGFTNDREATYQLWRERVHPEDLSWVEQKFLESLENRTYYEAEYRVVHPDGSVHWILGRGKGIYDELGKPVRSLGVLLDISDRKRAEEALRKYERIVSNTKDGIALINRNYIYQIANQGYLTWCNKSASEVVGNFVKNILGADLFDNFIQPLLDRCLAGETIQYERWFDSPNLVPQFLSVTYTPFCDAGEKNSGVIISLRDLTQLKQVQQTLELQAVITRNMAEGICLVRTDNAAIVYANPKFEQMFGYDCEELNGKHVSILNYARESLSPEDVYQAIRSAVLHGGEFSYEVENVKKDGTLLWCSATCSVFKHPEYGDVLVAVQQDITESKQAQAALLQKSRQENLLWTITQAIRQSLDLNDILNTAVTEVKQTLQVDRAAIYRFTPDWSGDFVVESVDPQWVKLVECNIQKACEDVYLQETKGGRFRNHETFAIADIDEAGLHPCHIQLLQQFQAKAYLAVPIFSGELLWGLLIIYQNTAPRNWQSWEIELLEQISSQLAIAIQQSQLYTQLELELQERQQATAVIREAERRWRSLLENVQLIVVGLDASGNINYVNPFFVGLTGYTNEEVLGNNWFENFLPSSSQQSTEADFLELLTHNAHPYYRNVILTKSGEERFIAWNNTMLQDSDGTIIGSINIGEDITERNKVEQIKDEFIGIVSHELRTPLTAIQMSLGLLKTGIYDKKPEKSRRMIEIALIDTNRLVNLVNDILDLERLESGRAFLDKTVCKAADLMQQVVDALQAIATQNQISLIITPTDAEVWAAADAILQTLTNLLSNALKFSDVGSAIYLSAQKQTDCVLFQVRDRGRGIPADKLELVFGRFQQVDASDSREKGGTGLGLPICRSIIEQHGGKIWVESIFGEGSTFFFTLPLPAIE
ncbi:MULTISPECIES: PAS domain S-box protein [unclassified Microcoleus]|uniref:PAS domain S-box protein n=1 Tax=unclassified Microcoleus TaxID=2642155 RepID=UPI0025EAD23A|nr:MULTISPECIES: PAS domain S-box protein [unclassified Microcoleus]